MWRRLTSFTALSYCAGHYTSGVREEGETPSRSRRCKWGRNPSTPLSEKLRIPAVSIEPYAEGESQKLFTRWEGAGSRVNHEPEDLLGALTVVPSRAGERVRMKKRVQSSRSVQALGIFSFDAMAPISPRHHRAPGGAVGVVRAGSRKWARRVW